MKKEGNAQQGGGIPKLRRGGKKKKKIKERERGKSVGKKGKRHGPIGEGSRMLARNPPTEKDKKKCGKKNVDEFLDLKQMTSFTSAEKKGRGFGGWGGDPSEKILEKPTGIQMEQNGGKESL